MAKVSTYLNFPGTTEEAFNFYKQVFKTEFMGEIMRFKDVPAQDGGMPVSEADGNLIMNIALPILGGHVIMGTDATETMGFKVVFGNNMYMTLEPDTREEAQRLFDELSAGGKVEMPMQDMFWGDFYGSFVDKFGTPWMINCSERK